MMNVNEIKEWIATLGPQNSVGIDDGGLTLVEIDQDGDETGAYLEVGSMPQKGGR